MTIGQNNKILQLDKAVHCHQLNRTDRNCFHLGPVSLTIRAGEVVAIVGPSGSGKTTLLRVIAGLETSREGQLIIDDKKMFDAKIFVPPERRKVGMVFQDHALFPHLTVQKNILFGIRKWTKADQEIRLEELCNLLGLKEYLDRYPHELSGGQQQRVALARTLAPKPKIVLLDEPLSNIDADLRSSLAQDLHNVLKQTNTTALWVTHDQSEALDLADRIIVINEGKIEQVDDPWSLYNQPKTRFVADFVGHAVFIPGELTKTNEIKTEIGSVTCLPCLQTAKRQEVMIRPDDVKAVEDKNGSAIVFKRQFFGSMQLYSLRLPSGQVIMTNQPPHINWPIGTKVTVDLDVSCAVAFPLE